MCTADILGKEKGGKEQRQEEQQIKLSLSLVINPGKCSVQNERQPEKAGYSWQISQIIL